MRLHIIVIHTVHIFIAYFRQLVKMRLFIDSLIVVRHHFCILRVPLTNIHKIWNVNFVEVRTVINGELELPQGLPFVLRQPFGARIVGLGEKSSHLRMKMRMHLFS